MFTLLEWGVKRAITIAEEREKINMTDLEWGGRNPNIKGL